MDSFTAAATSNGIPPQRLTTWPGENSRATREAISSGGPRHRLIRLHNHIHVETRRLYFVRVEVANFV